jgi:23S rRNA pseudouridine1911/1915/1917 synthase
LVSLRVSLPAAAVGQRVDRALVDALAQQGHAISRSQLARSFAADLVRSEGRPLAPGRKLERPCEVELELLDAELPEAFAEAIALTIVHEDASLLVIDKPAGMVVHAGPGHARGSLVNAVLHHLAIASTEDSTGLPEGSTGLPVLPGNGPERAGLVHRLDRDTSGLIVVAKTMPALTTLAEQLRAHTIERSYLGVVLGDPSWDTLRVETRHGRDPADRRRFSPEHGERQAVTHIAVVRRLCGRASLLRFVLETGRTHQIRMHARHIGHPIIADALYGRRPRDTSLRKLADELGRHALHAAVLGFRHPDGGVVRFESPLPPAIAELVRQIAAIRQ